MKANVEESPNLELLRQEVLHTYKIRFGAGEFNNSPFSEEVTRYDTRVSGYDVSAIHHDVRERIASIINGIHAEQPSQVVILTGNPGMGKTHLINAFRDRGLAEELGYILVCNSNHWKAAEFEECLLDWILSSLAYPALDEPHLLLGRIQDVAFQALRQIIDRPGEMARYQPKKMLSVVRRLWRLISGAEHGHFLRAIDTRDVEIFRRLDFPEFATFVCNRYLVDSGNIFHRYVVHVLLRYLFVEDREKVLHWLRGKDVGSYFLKRLGMRDEVDHKAYKVFEAVKILVSLFTPEVSAKLQSPGAGTTHDRVFFFAFDQSEAREALFQSKEEWTTFFGQLSELYNALPNVFILFTMTLGLRNQHFSKMEAQFRDRIRHDQQFVLNEIKPREILAMFRQRMERWLGTEVETIRPKLEALQNPFLPFEQAKVLEMAGTGMSTLRDMLKCFDSSFREVMQHQVSDVRLDYQVYLNELNRVAAKEPPHSVTESHPQTMQELLRRAGLPIARLADIDFHSVDTIETPGTQLQGLRIQFCSRNDPGRWVRVFVLRLPFVYKSSRTEALGLLSNLLRARNFLWLLRANGVDPTWQAERPEQVRIYDLRSAEVKKIEAVGQMWQHKDRYSDEAWSKDEPYLLAEVEATYLGGLVKNAAHALGRLGNVNETSESPEADEAPVSEIPASRA